MGKTEMRRATTEAVFDEDCHHWKATAICKDQDLKVEVMFGQDGEIGLVVTRYVVHEGDAPVGRYVLEQFAPKHRAVIMKLTALDEGDGQKSDGAE